MMDGKTGMRYRADITAGSLKVPESRIITDLLLQGVNETGWKEALYAQNVLQTRNPKTTKRLVLLLRGRLELDDGVKVNYGKFGDLLAEVKAVTGVAPECTTKDTEGTEG
jgi:hypothetical protein